MPRADWRTFCALLCPNWGHVVSKLGLQVRRVRGLGGGVHRGAAHVPPVQPAQVRQLRHPFPDQFSRFPQPYHPARAVQYALLSADSDRVLTGACNLMQSHGMPDSCLQVILTWA